MFKDKKLLVTGGTGSIGGSICNYFYNNGCEEIYSTTTNINKVKSNQSYIKFKEYVRLMQYESEKAIIRAKEQQGGDMEDEFSNWRNEL